jgi:hypothetical protein
VHYRLCVCASGSWMIDKFSFLTAIRVSCLHLGQYNGKLSSIVSLRIFNLNGKLAIKHSKLIK